MTDSQFDELIDTLDDTNMFGGNTHKAFIQFCNDYGFSPDSKVYYKALEVAQSRLDEVRLELGITPLSDYEREQAFRDIESRQ